MTREEQIINAIDTTFPIPSSEKGRNYEQALMATGFEGGAKWADSNPKSPWISVEDDLPYRRFELLEPIPTENFKGETISVLVIDNKGYSWFDYMVLYKNIWKWKYLESEPSYWMQIPELPKE